MPEIRNFSVNQQIPQAIGAIQVHGAYAGPPSRLSLDDLSISTDDFPLSMGHQHNRLRGNTFEALTLRTPASNTRLALVDWQDQSQTDGVGRLQRSSVKEDHPAGFELSFGQALFSQGLLNSAEHRNATPIRVSDISALVEAVLKGGGSDSDQQAHVAEFELSVGSGQVTATVPQQQILVGRKAPFSSLQLNGATQTLTGACQIIGVVTSKDTPSSVNTRFDALKPLHDQSPTLRAIVLNDQNEFCGELTNLSQVQGQLKTAFPAQVLLTEPTAEEVNQKWQQDAQELLAKAGNPPVKEPCTSENINDTEIESMSDVTKAKLLGLLAGVTDIFHRADIPYILACGTELGNARNQDLIKWDDDIDIVVPMEHIGEMLARRDEFLEQGILITPRYHGVKFSFLDDKQREKDGTPYPFVDIFAVEKNSQGEWEFEDVVGCKIKFPLEQLPPNVFQDASKQSFGPQHLGIKVNTMPKDTSLLYLNRIYGGDSEWSKDSNILNKAYTHTYDHDTGASKEPQPLNVTEFEPGSTPKALWPLGPRQLQKPLSEHHKYVPELMKHLEAHQDNWRLPEAIKTSWPRWVADLSVSQKYSDS